jgi:hypothetical protein
MGSASRIAAWILAVVVVLAVAACVASSIHSAITDLHEKQRDYDARMRAAQVEAANGGEAEAWRRVHAVNAAVLNARRT